MFDDPFVFFALVIAIVALILARKAMNQVAELRAQLEAIWNDSGHRDAHAAAADAAGGVRADTAAGHSRGHAGAAAHHP